MRNTHCSRRALLALPLVLSWRPVPAQSAAPARAVLSISGRGLGPPAADGRIAFEMAALERLPQRKIVTATPWYSGASEFTGPLLREVLAAAGAPAPAPGGKARFIALNDYRVEIPLEDAWRWDVVVARLLNGKPMAVREKGPLFVIYPFDEQPQLRTATYYSRCIWQLKAIELG